MSATITIKNSIVPGRIPPSLALGELAINVVDGKLFYGDGSGVKLLAASGSGSSGGGGGGTVTSVQLTQGTGISLSGTNPITSTGNITITNTAPDQTVVLTNGSGITVTGTYPNFTITNSSPDQTVSLNNGTNIEVTGTYPNFTINSTIDTTSFVATSSFNQWTGSNQSQFAGTSSYSSTASYALNSIPPFPYTGSATITGSLVLTGSLLVTQSSISKVDYIDFTPNKYDTVTPGTIPTQTEGRLFYDTGSQTLCMYNAEADVTLNIGQEQWLRARNQTGVTITNGSVVKIIGAIGNRPSVALAQAVDQIQTFGVDNDIIGMATHDIETGTDGFITTFGLVNKVNTNAFNAGDLLWLSSSAGQYTNVAPSAPIDKTFVGVVTRKGNANVGSIFVFPNQPIHFHDLSSVSASSAYTQGDIWMFKASGSSGVWTNTKILSGSYVISGSLTTNDGFQSQTITASVISASSSITGSLFGTASWAQTAVLAPNYVPIGSQGTTSTISGSLVINQNLTVIGSSSIQYITSSQVNIGTNIVYVNTATPAIRFGGLAVYDSGSTGTGLTGSLLWDSQNDVWIYSNPSGAAYDGAMMLVGPRNSSGLGNEVGINSGYAAIGNGSHHMTSSVIWNSGSLIRLETNTQVTGSLNASQGITGSLFGTSSWAVSASQAISTSYATSAETTSTIAINSFGSNVDSYLLMSNVLATPGVAIGGDSDLTYNASTNKLTVANISATTLTGSLQGTASWANNFTETDPVFVAKSASLATTGSNTFTGNQTIKTSISVTTTDFSGGSNGGILSIGTYGSAIGNTDSYITARKNGGSAAGTLILQYNTGDKVAIGKTSANDRLDVNGNTIITGSLNVTTGITGSFLGSLQGTASWATDYVSASNYVLNSQTSSFTQLATGSVTASVTQTQFIVRSGSTVEFSVTGTGANIGSATTDTHTITGSLNLLGNQTITGSLSLSGSGVQFPLQINGSITQVNVSSSGNVGIGTTTPTTPLYVAGNTTLRAASGATNLIIGGSQGAAQNVDGNLFISSSLGNNVYIQTYRSAAPLISSAANNNLRIGTNGGTTTMVLFSATRNVSIQDGGTFTDNGFRLDVSGSTRFNGNSTITGSVNINGSTTVASGGSLTLASGSVTLTSGSITMPNRPAFRVVGTSSNNIPTSTIISGSAASVDYNQGGYYNNTTGTFTAPIAGLYNIYMNIRCSSINAQQQAILLKNATTALMWEAAGNTGATHFGVSGIVNLAVNDTLKVNVAVGSVQFDGNDSWGATYIG